MQKEFETIIKHLVGTHKIAPKTGIDICGQFSPQESSAPAISRNINAAFLILLAGETHPNYHDALSYFEAHVGSDMVVYYQKMLGLIQGEIGETCAKDKDFREAIEALHQKFLSKADTIEDIWRVFFPQACGISQHKEEEIEKLRQHRKITLTKPNENPIKDIAKEMLFTSNVLLTIPAASQDIDTLGFSPSFATRLKEVTKEPQKYWYDHPIQIGVEIEKNEAIYGLVGLNEAVAFEKQKGTLGQEEKINCLLSVSVTHDGLTALAQSYLEAELKKVDTLENLNIYVITEANASAIVERCLAPIARHFNLPATEALQEIFGVDGEYGRHYSLLKAIAGFWQVFVAPETRATFKFDLDQIFPQEVLVKESGLSAFEHFQSALWGAEGIDSEGAKVELGMIAGALVNQSDIEKSLFTPDVTFSDKKPKGSQVVFYSALPQALSTEAEMMLRYHDSAVDGVHSALSRIHVTGGTNGIMIESLRKHRPFTPSFIGRAEDQAYILSVLFSSEASLRYVHKDGLIMRHDKHAFAQESIEAAKLGKMIGDYVRILYFSYYVKALPWDEDKIKEAINPFTGSFVSSIPFSVVALRMALEAAAFFDTNQMQEGHEFLTLGIKRVDETITTLLDGRYLKAQFLKEKSGWDDFYDILDVMEEGLVREDSVAMEIRTKASTLMEAFKLQ